MILPSEYSQSLQVGRDRQIHEDTTALLLIGFQNEYFSLHGALRSDIEDTEAPEVVLANTTALLEQLVSTRVLLISAPIIFTPTYEELINPVGALAAIKAKGAFQRNTKGAQLASELGPFVARITHIAGRRGLSAFSNTALQDLLVAKGIRNLFLAGSLSCVCVDSTARAAAE